MVEPAVTFVPLPLGPCSGDTVGTVTSQPAACLTSPSAGYNCMKSSRKSAAPFITG